MLAIAALALVAAACGLLALVRSPPPAPAPQPAPQPAPRLASGSAADDRAAGVETRGRARASPADSLALEPAKHAGAPAAAPARDEVHEPNPRIPPPRAHDPSEPLDALQHEVSRLYNRREFEAAKAEAEAVLAKQPGDDRMLRIAASAACILGERAAAVAHYQRMEPPDRRRVRERCERHGVALDP